MLKLYDSLTQSIKNFIPINEQRVTMYVCGPTVYGDIHIGNARPVIFFDTLKRYLKYLGYDVFFVSNITDVDDKIIEKAIELNIKEHELTHHYTQKFIEMTQSIGSILPDVMPKATEYIDQMIAYIEKLIHLDFAYVRPSGVYFRVHKVNDYGILSNQVLEELSQGVRILLDTDKEDPKDFTLWKTTTQGVSFNSPWGLGRPGWHTECAVMNEDIFKGEIDIHGGGSDLKFPHHENEIAQCNAMNHHHLARFWMHVGRLDMSNEKMSKSIGNTVLLKDLIQEFHPLAFRLFILTHHYRQKINYTNELMMQYQKEYDKIIRAMKKAFLTISLSDLNNSDVLHDAIMEFKSFMDDDFNTPNVLTLIQNLIKQMNKTNDVILLHKLLNTLKLILNTLGCDENIEIDQQVLKDYRDWEKARNDKNYEQADLYRQRLINQGWI